MGIQREQFSTLLMANTFSRGLKDRHMALAPAARLRRSFYCRVARTRPDGRTIDLATSTAAQLLLYCVYVLHVVV